MSGDAQAGAGDRFAVLVVHVGSYGLDGFAVQSGAGEIRQADFVAAYFQIVGGALSQCLADLDLQLLLLSLCGLNQLGASLYCSTRVSKTLILMCVPLFNSLGEWSDVRTGVPDGMSINYSREYIKMECCTMIWGANLCKMYIHGNRRQMI